jgi:hypothetical protein
MMMRTSHDDARQINYLFYWLGTPITDAPDLLPQLEMGHIIYCTVQANEARAKLNNRNLSTAYSTGEFGS